MPRRSTSTYPPDWPEIARRVKEEAGWRCVRCGHPHDPAAGYTLTVHHLDMSPANNAWFNTLPCCQRCHLHIQSKVVMERIYLFPHTGWFVPYVAGYYAAAFGLIATREAVAAYAEHFIDLGTGTDTPAAVAAMLARAGYVVYPVPAA